MRELITKIIKEHTSTLLEYVKGNTEDFIKKAEQVHQDENGKPLYNYDKVDYKDNKTHIIITCPKPEHGDFAQAPDHHLMGKGCPVCWEDRRGLSKRGFKSTEDFIDAAKKVHGDKYDYSNSIYKGNKKHLSVYCPKHDIIFPITPEHLLKREQGCPRCSIEKRANTQRKPLETFISQAKKIHGDKYNYDFVDYKNVDIPVKIICPKHGEFDQTPYVHVNLQSGCPYCRESKGERMTSQVLDNLGIKYKRQFRFDDCISDYGIKLPFDFYLPEFNTLIEYDGKQHFEPISDRDYEHEGILKRDLIKNNYAQKNKIKLIRIPYTFNTPELIEKDLKRFLQKK